MWGVLEVMPRKSDKIKPLQMYVSNLERAIKRGLADVPTALSDCEVQVGYEVLYSRNSERCYYYVKALPQYIQASFYNAVRMQIALCRTSHPVFVNFRIQGTPHYIDWNSSTMKERRRQWLEHEQTKEITDSRFSDSSSRESSAFDKWRMQSWEYIQNAEDRKVQLIDCEITIELATDGTTNSHKLALLDACKEFEQWCAKNDIKIKKVRNSIADFLKYTSITSLDTKANSAKKVMNRVLSSEILADMVSYTPGKINDTGVLFGIDVMTGMAVYKNLVRSGGDAENFLVLAETGGGKSAYMKALIIQMALNGYHQIVLDVDGEYRETTKVLDGVVINMSKAAGLYFDSTIIGDLTGDPEIDLSLLADSRATTVGIFNILCDTEEGMTSTEIRLFNEAFNRLYARVGVDPADNRTWQNSRTLSFHKLYQEICSLRNDPAFASYERQLSDFIDKLFVYFDPAGIRSYLFQTPISLADILSQRGDQPMFVDIVLNLASSQIGQVDVEGLIKQSTATYLVTLLTNYFKSRHEFSVHYIEEYQRYAESPGVESLVVYMVTGNRKRNAATFIISNSPQKLLGMGGAAAQAIVDNVTNYIIGKIKRVAIKDVCEAFSLADSEWDLTNFIERSEVYKYCFLLKINNKDTTVVKQDIPPELLETPLFKTRDTKKEKKNAEA